MAGSRVARESERERQKERSENTGEQANILPPILNPRHALGLSIVSLDRAMGNHIWLYIV